ncbi:MAG: helix-hairpin-helix domain-containing protein [Cyclobacteriaceae bacterium]
MNKAIQLSFLALALFAVACQSNSNQSAAEEPTAEATEAQPFAAEPAATKAAFINPNLATIEELSALEGLGSELAEMIVDQRPFLTMNDLDAKLTALNETQREALYQTFFVPFNLNTTAEDDFKLIPGVGDRMAHEFEEYRPYLRIEQFRKEIGKYVDEAEVARLEQFVFVPVNLNTASESDIMALPGVGSKMAHEFEEYRPYQNMEQFRREIGKYVDDKELARLERFVYLEE